ncbi:hypothetical protein V5O48_017687 [Marasmius crinis-equi]|uniref:Uncharacterized protein n=1 Tax=Marasmius crinis-equi TaxID=585013 RepID=A0ABR3ENB1_9AGAR
MGGQRSRKPEDAWIDKYMKDHYLPLIGDWENWKPGQPLLQDTTPANWIMQTAWPAYKAEFKLEEAANIETLRKNFGCKFRSFKEKGRSQAGKALLNAVIAGTMPYSTDSAEPGSSAVSATPREQPVSNRKLSGAIPWAADLTGREMYLAQEGERLNDAVSQERQEKDLPREQHAGMLQKAKKIAWDSLSDVEQGSWNEKAKAIAQQPPDVFTNQMKMLNSLPDVVASLPGMDKYQIGCSALLLVGSYRDANDALQTFSLQERYPKGDDFELGDFMTAWKAHCNEVLPVAAPSGNGVQQGEDGSLYFPPVTDSMQHDAILYNLEIFFKKHWEHERGASFSMEVLLDKPSDYLRDELETDIGPLLSCLKAGKKWALRALADKLHEDRVTELFKPPNQSTELKSTTAPTPTPPPVTTSTTVPRPAATTPTEPKTPAKTKPKPKGGKKAGQPRKGRNNTEAITHGQLGDQSPTSSDHDWQVSPNATPNATPNGTKVPGKSKQADTSGLTMSITDFLAAQQASSGINGAASTQEPVPFSVADVQRTTEDPVLRKDDTSKEHSGEVAGEVTVAGASKSNKAATRNAETAKTQSNAGRKRKNSGAVEPPARKRGKHYDDVLLPVNYQPKNSVSVVPEVDPNEPRTTRSRRKP